ncbi:hypothetical protein HDE_04291 [Halotydeus destructor]|nr:hypothetical protein HDE_04291 [Halotydeus destructor]
MFIKGSCLLAVSAILFATSVPSVSGSTRKQIASMLDYILSSKNFGHSGVVNRDGHGKDEEGEGHGTPCCKAQYNWKFGNWPGKGLGWQWGLYPNCHTVDPNDSILYQLIAKAFRLEKQAVKAAVAGAKVAKVEAKTEKVVAAKELKTEKIREKTEFIKNYKEGDKDGDKGHEGLPVAHPIYLADGHDFGHGHGHGLDFGEHAEFSQLMPILMKGL